MSNTIKHAKREFKILGYTPVEESKEEDPNKWIQENVLELLEVFSKQGHSGTSAPYCIRMFEKLANHKLLSPITGAPEEFMNVADDVFQNTRCSAVFKKSKDSEPYYLDAIVFREEDGSCFTGNAFLANGKKLSSSQTIKLPFIEKTFYIDVKSEEVAKDDWEHYVADESQLDEVFEYYKYPSDLLPTEE